jgi:hypothetical protein
LRIISYARVGSVAYYALYQRLYLQVTGADAVHGRDKASKYMIESVELLGVLDGHHVLNVLHDTDGRSIASRVGTDGTDVRVANVVAHTTELHLSTHSGYGFGKAFNVGSILT